MNEYKRIYNEYFGNLGNLKQKASKEGWSVDWSEIDGSIEYFKKLARKSGWKTKTDKWNGIIHLY